MEQHRQTDFRRTNGEEGYMLLAVVVMAALVLIALSVAAPVVAKDLRRDKEVESQHRMQQYVRAIRMYQLKFPGQYPPSIKALEGSNNIRYLRHVYVDPLTGKADYRLIHQGEQQTKIHVFFGQELAGLAASLGSAAGLASPGGAGQTTNVTSTNALNAGFGDASYGTSGSTGSTGSTGSSAFGDGTGGVIVGVGTSRTGNSITDPNGQDTYEKWEFWYDPRIELLRKKVQITGGGGMGSTSASNFGTGLDGLNGATGSTGLTGSTGNQSGFH